MSVLHPVVEIAANLKRDRKNPALHRLSRPRARGSAALLPVLN